MMKRLQKSELKIVVTLFRHPASIYVQMQDDNYYIDLILKGNVNAFTCLVDKHKGMVYTFALRMVGVAEDAEEISHDAFVKAYMSLRTFKNQSKFSTWLYRIVYNECISRLRKKKLPVRSYDEPGYDYLEPADSFSFLKDIDEREQKEIVQKAINRLPEDERSIISLFYMQECSIKEITEITGYLESNVKIKLYRARKHLHERLKNAISDKKLQKHESE